MTRLYTSHGIVIHTVVAAKSDVALDIHLYRVEGTHRNAIHTSGTFLQIDIYRAVRAPDDRVVLTRFDTLRLFAILAHQDMRFILFRRNADAAARHGRFSERA